MVVKHCIITQTPHLVIVHLNLVLFTWSTTCLAVNLMNVFCTKQSPFWKFVAKCATLYRACRMKTLSIPDIHNIDQFLPLTSMSANNFYGINMIPPNNTPLTGVNKHYGQAILKFLNPWQGKSQNKRKFDQFRRLTFKFNTLVMVSISFFHATFSNAQIGRK